MAREPTEREHAGPDDAMRRDLRGGYGQKPDQVEREDAPDDERADRGGVAAAEGPGLCDG